MTTLDEELQAIRKNRGAADPAALGGIALPGHLQDAPAAKAKPEETPPSVAPDDTAAPAQVDPFDYLQRPASDLPPPLGEEASHWDVWANTWTNETITQDAWGDKYARERELALRMKRQLPEDAQRRIEAQAKAMQTGWTTLQQVVVDEAAKVAQQSPEAAAQWAGYPLSIDAFNQHIDAGRRRDIDETTKVLNQPGGDVTEFIARTAVGATDPVSLMMLPLGLEGTLLRRVAGEAVLGAAGEAATIPRERQVAKELDLPEPDVTQRLALGFAFGGAFPLALHGAGAAVRQSGRIWSRVQGARAAMPDGADPAAFEHGVDTAEAAMTGQSTVQEALRPEAAQPGTLGAILDGGGNGPVTFDYRSGGNASAQTNRVGYVYGKLIDLGYDPKTAAALTGNLMQESGPGLNSRAVGDNGNAYGIGQWNGPRMRALQEFARRKGTDPSDLNTQIEFLHYELQGPERAALGRILAAPDAKTAALVASQEFWRPGVPHNERRMAFADAVASQYAAGKVPKWEGAAILPEATGGAAFTPTSRGYTSEGQVTAGDRFRINVRYEVVDLSTLKKAFGIFQPRDRSRIASDAWIADTAARLDPALLMPAPTADRGAPIVGPDNMIESGNGRVGAITRAYELHPDRAAAYRQQIEAAGFAVPEGVTQPVLIARRTSDFANDGERADFTVAGQDSGVAAMTATEVAKTSSRAMTAPVLAQFDPAAALGDAANGGFVRAVLSGLPRSVRNAMFGKDGMLNSGGLRQLRDALFARAWPAEDMIARYTEGDAGELKSLMEALEKSAPQWAALKADIEAGLVRPEMDISGHVLDAMRLIAAARDLAAREKGVTGKIVAQMLDEVNLMDGAVSPLTAALVRKFWRGKTAAPADEIATFLTRYADDARKAGTEGGMFDAPTPRDVLKAIDEKAFGDLPEDLGNVRGFARPGDAAQAEAIADTPVTGFDEGALSPEAAEVADEIKVELETPGPAAAASVAVPFRQLLEQNAPIDRLAQHPEVTAAIEKAASLPQTANAEGYGTPEWHASRQYVIDGQPVVGTVDALAGWERQADLLASKDLKQAPAPIRHDRELTIILGPPAAGKSTIANEIAVARSAAILDSDEIKKTLPEYANGAGASAVHEESSTLANMLGERMSQSGKNIVLPKVGERAASIQKQIDLYRAKGYRIYVVNMAVSSDTAMRRMMIRFADSGRIIPPEYMKAVGELPSATYRELKAKGVADGYAEISNEGGLDQPKPVLDIAGDNPLRGSRFDVQPGGQRGSDPAGSVDGYRQRQPGQAPAGQSLQGITSAAAPDELQALSDRARAEIDAGGASFRDVSFQAADGSEMTVAEILDDIDADEGFDAFIQACAINNSGGAAQ